MACTGRPQTDLSRNSTFFLNICTLDGVTLVIIIKGLIKYIIIFVLNKLFYYKIYSVTISHFIIA